MKIRYLLSLIVLFVGLVATVNPVHAQVKIGPHIGLDFEDSDLFVGGNVLAELGLEVGDQKLLGNADASYWITGDGYNLFIIDANLLYPFMLGNLNAYGGGGLVISFFSYDIPDFNDFFSKSSAVANSESETDFGLNLKGGVEFPAGNLLPFGEVGFYIKDGGFLYIQGGLRFGVGGS
jgi:hypothetical protein